MKPRLSFLNHPHLTKSGEEALLIALLTAGLLGLAIYIGIELAG